MKQTDYQDEEANVLTLARIAKANMNQHDYAIIVNKDGSFQGIVGPERMEDFDQLPEAIAKMLTILYGDVFDITFDRKIN